MRVGYLLSDCFPYSKLLCADAGPAIAYEYSWTPCTIATVEQGEFDCLVVDNRHHTNQDIMNLRFFLSTRQIRPVFLRVNDPYVFHKQDHWYQFCAEQVDAPGIHLLTPYQPTGLLSYWLSHARRSHFVYAPFTYDPQAELPIAHRQRQGLFAVSGNQRKDLYPLRYLVQIAAKIPGGSLLLGLDRLQHPGYPEKIKHARHCIMDAAYIQWLARYRFAFVDSSIYRVELLKYREAAYAGCALIGDLPWSLHECPSDAFYHFRSLVDLIKCRAVLGDSQLSQEVANSYRTFMRSTRNRASWRVIVAEALARLS
jgi:hypothetical protein